MIKTTQLAYRYSMEHPELTFPDISLPKASSTVLLGRSGSGKSTLLHLLAGLLHPTKGEIWMDDIKVSALRGAKQDAFRGSHIGLVFQKPVFAASLSAMDNLKLAASLSSTIVTEHMHRAMLQRLGITDKANKKPQELSAGEQQRLSIARALAHSPQLVLADEPTSALDDTNAQAVVQLLKEVAHERSSTLLLVTHDYRVSSAFERRIEL